MVQARDYAQALLSLSADKKADAAELLKNLKSVLARRGHTRLLPRIVAEYERAAHLGTRGKMKIRVASHSDEAAGKKEAKRLIEERALEVGEIEVCIDPSLIQGFAVDGPGFRYDQSSRAALIALYKRLTTHY